MITVAINGFGRIGRRVFRLLHNHPSIKVIAINDLADAKTLAHLLKYDSIHGVFPAEIFSTENSIVVNNKKIPLDNKKHPENRAIKGLDRGASTQNKEWDEDIPAGIREYINK